MKKLLPEGWPRPKGYSNGISVEAGTMVFIAGVIGWDHEEVFKTDELVAQFRQTLINTKAIMAEAGATPEHMVRLTWYITDKADYLSKLKEIGRTYREVMGKNYPAMACIEVCELMEDRAKIEIETTCVIERKS